MAEYDETFEDCTACNGTGQTRYQVRDRVIVLPCRGCDGEGIVSVMSTRPRRKRTYQP